MYNKCSVYLALYNLCFFQFMYIMYVVQYTPYIVRRILYDVYYTYNIQRTVYAVHCTTYTTLHYKPYTVRRILQWFVRRTHTLYGVLYYRNAQRRMYVILRTTYNTYKSNVSRTFDVRYRDRIESYKGKLGRNLY